MTKERDPALTAILGLALAVTTFGVGLALHAPLAYLAGVWVCALTLLLVRRAYGGLGRGLERFGVVHGATLCLAVIVSVATRRHG